MRRLGLSSYKWLLLAAVVVFGLLTMQSSSPAQESNNGYRLSVAGIAVSDYAKSQDFYANKMGLREAFKFTNRDGTRTTTYYQLSRDSFLEMQQAGGDVHPGFTHVHMVVNDLDATIARLKQNGIPGSARNAKTPGTVTEAGVAQPSNVKNADIYDPDGLTLELNELMPESLTKKAMDSWTDTYPSYELIAVGIDFKDFGVSGDFYEKKMGVPVAYLVGNNPKHPYLQLSRSTFVDFAESNGNTPPSMTHIHLLVDDLTKTVARLKQNGVTLSTPGLVAPSQVYAANITDPDGLRLELNQWLDSLPKKAAEAWK